MQKYLTMHDKGMAIAAIPVENHVITERDAIVIAGILGDTDAFRRFDALAGSGSKLADEYGCWKVRQARNGHRIFFDALTAAEVGGAAWRAFEVAYTIQEGDA